MQTIDHVLDFAKITRKVKERSTRIKPGRRLRNDYKGGKSRDTTKNEIQDLRALTEEVIDSVYAGRRSWKTKETIIQADINSFVPNVAPIIIMDIAWLESWRFDIDDGAWRRILMNLFSNAVKYTKRGFVRVALTVEFDDVTGKEKRHPRLCLEIHDSGVGISQEFLKNHIYTAFKQEDALSVGTGLGLSIVRQIILDLGGSIDIKSEVGVGTHAYVSLPLSAMKRRNPKVADDLVAETKQRTTGAKVCLVNTGFDITPSMADDLTGILSAEAEAVMLLKSSVHSISADWFGMDVIMSSKMDMASADVHVTTDSSAVEEEISNATRNSSFPTGSKTVIIICSTMSHNSNYVTDGGVNVYHVQQP
jgi:two-component sensor histidine kinase